MIDKTIKVWFMNIGGFMAKIEHSASLPWCYYDKYSKRHID